MPGPDARPSDDVALSATRAAVEKFESRFDEALGTKYLPLYGPDWRQWQTRWPQWKLIAFFEALIASGRYDPVRISGVMSRLVDLKLQVYFITEVDIGARNRLYYDEINQRGNPYPPPLDLLLRKLSFDQNLIGKSRVLWERVMNLVWFMEHGSDMDGTRSKKQRFFKWVRESPSEQFDWLLPFESYIERYDQRFRTPEFHKNSVLRGEFMGEDSIDPNVLLGPINAICAIAYDNLLSVVKSERPALRYLDADLTTVSH
jgi:hypothetical protein